MLQEMEIKIKELEVEIFKLQKEDNPDNDTLLQELEDKKKEYQKKAYKNITSYDRVYLARKKDRPHTKEFIANLFDDFIEMHGDRKGSDDGSIIGGIATFNTIPVTVIGHVKGNTLEENLACNFGMSSSGGYRKALRLMQQAEKFHRPIITFIDTPGAYPGLEAEKEGIGEAIAQHTMTPTAIRVPIICIVTGEGGSGGALALGVGDRLVMLENAIYSIISPEGFASILWKDKEGKRVAEASEVMKLTAKDLHAKKVIDTIIPEPQGGITCDKEFVYKQLRRYLQTELATLTKISVHELTMKRYEKYRTIGNAR